MASYRNISMDFWTDSKVVDDFTPEDRYIYLYCMTNPHTNLCGCYEVSIKQIANETGYNNDSVERLLKRLDSAHNVIRYSAQTKELLILNWCRYNWSTSEKLNKPLLGEIRKVKNDRFREYLAARYNERSTVTAQYNAAEEDRPEVPRHKHGAHGWVRLTEEEYARLIDDLGEEELTRCIDYIDESAQMHGNKNKWRDWNLVIRKCSRERWGIRGGNGLAYPNAEVFKGGIAKLGPTINLWVTCLPEIDFWTGQQAVVKLVRECKFPPTIAEFKEKAEKVQAEVRARIDQAWNYLKLDMDFGKTPEEAVARLSEGTDIRRVIEAMGGPSRLIATGERTFGDGTVKTYEYYNYDGFKSAYETIIRQTSALNSGPRKAVGPGMKQIGGKT